MPNTACSRRSRLPRLSLAHKYPQITRGHKNSFSFLQAHGLITFLGKLDFDQVSSISPGEFKVNERPDGVNMTDSRLDRRRAVAVARDFDFMETLVPPRRRRSRFAVVALGLRLESMGVRSNPGQGWLTLARALVHMLRFVNTLAQLGPSVKHFEPCALRLPF